MCAEHDIVQKFVKPDCRWQNGKVGRLNRTRLTEWAYRGVFTSNEERGAALAPWIESLTTLNAFAAHAEATNPPIGRLLPT